MGGRGGQLWQRIIFQLAPPSPPPSPDAHFPAPKPTSGPHQITPEHPPELPDSRKTPLQPGVVSITDRKGGERLFPSHFLDFLEAELRMRKAGDCGLPFDFTGGYIGYLGYELKAECGSPGRHISPHPDAAMFFADRSPPLPCRCPLFTGSHVTADTRPIICSAHAIRSLSERFLVQSC